MSFLSVYKIIFMTELLVAEAMLTFKMAKRKNFVWRVLGAIAVCYVVAVFFPVVEGVSYSSWYSSLMFFTFFVVSYFALVFVYDITWTSALFCAFAAYTIQHLAYGLFSVFASLADAFEFGGMYGDALIDFSSFNEITLLMVMCYLDIYAFTYVVSYFIFKPYFKYNQDLKLKSAAVMIFIAVILVVDILLNAIVVYITDDKIKDYILYVYNILCCILAFYMQVELINNKNMKSELESMSEALKLAQNQYAMKKENIDLINIKCHDLKYRISQFAHMGGLDKESIEEMEKMISIYDASVETDNEILNVILTEKSLICSDKNIKLTCMVDSSGMDFIKEGDLYVLFGNIIDNAIEAVTQIDDEGKRCIGLNVHTSGGLKIISCINYYSGTIKFSPQGLPQTNKKDEEYHGFGMKSIALLVERYGGTVSINADGGVFNLGISFPLKTDKK